MCFMVINSAKSRVKKAKPLLSPWMTIFKYDFFGKWDLNILP